MNIQSFKKALPFMIKHKIPLFLWGSQGIGKTQTVGQFAKENGLELVTLHTATQDVGDLIGLLVKDEDNKTVSHARPEWFPTKGKGIIFLDELNRAPTDVIQALFPFITEGRLHTHVLPKGWYVMGAGNYQSDRFTVTDTSDAAWLSRFCHLDFMPTVEEWLVHAESKGAFNVAGFIREQPTMLELSAKDAGRLDTSFIVPDRRSMLNGPGQLESDTDFPEELKFEVYSGMIGVAAAAAFMSWKAKAEKSLTLAQILHGYKGAVRDRVRGFQDNKGEVRFDLLNQPIDELLTKLEILPQLLSSANALDNIKAFLLDIPRELSMKAFTRMSALPTFFGKKEILNDKAYVSNFK
jgi:hypothetical protein